MKKKYFSVLIMLIISMIFFLGFYSYASKKTYTIPEENTAENETVISSSEDIVIWYTEDSQKDYLESAAVTFFKKNGVSIDAIKVSSLDYIELINEFNIKGKGAPDLFITGSESLEKVYMAGLTKENKNTDLYNEKNFPAVAVNAATYKGKIVAYPLNYTTSVMIYNKNYVESEPESFDGVLEFSKNYVTEEGSTVSNVLRWNVADIMSNYFFAGKYIEFGGITGDDSSVLDLNNENVILAMDYYKNLHTFFSIDISTISSDKIFEEFTNQECIFSIIETDYIKEIMESEVEYGIMNIPDLTDTLESQGLSATKLVVVNPYSDNISNAEKVAKYITYDYAGKMFDTSGEMSCRFFDDYPNWETEAAMKQYKETVSLPKFRTAGDFWLKLQGAFNAVWVGADTKETMDNLQNEMQKKIETK